MKTPIKLQLLGLLLFLGVMISGTVMINAVDHHLQKQYLSRQIAQNSSNSSLGIQYQQVSILRAPESQKGPVYYVKIGDTISLLKDPQGYITAATRLGMETIKVVPDKSGKYYRTVSLDLKQSDEDLKQAIEVKVSEIIVK